MSGRNILLLDGHTVQVLPMARALKKNGHTVTIFCEEKLSFGWFSRFPDVKVVCPRVIQEPEAYLAFLEKYLGKHPQNLIIPLFNDTADLVSRNKSRLEKYAKVQVPDYPVFIRGYNKNLTLNAARDIDVPHPRTADLDEMTLEEAAEYCGFPSLIKPNIASGARGITQINSLDDLRQAYPEIQKDFGSCTLQEYIPQTGSQYKCQMFRDRVGNIYGATVQKKYRYFPVTGGSTTCNEIVNVPEIVESSRKILDELNWDGFADFDYIEDERDGQYKIMEINPRVPACIRSCFDAGVDFAEMMVCHKLGEPIPSYTCSYGWVMRYMALEVLWFLFSKERLHAKPSWFHFWGKKLCYQDGAFDDPLPMLVGFMLGIRKYANPKFRKAKLSFNKRPQPKDSNRV